MTWDAEQRATAATIIGIGRARAAALRIQLADLQRRENNILRELEDYEPTGDADPALLDTIPQHNVDITLLLPEHLQRALYDVFHLELHYAPADHPRHDQPGTPPPRSREPWRPKTINPPDRANGPAPGGIC